VSDPFKELFDRHISGWKEDNFSLRYALSIPREDVWKAHLQSKRELIHFVNREANAGMDVDLFTIGFARRTAPYKRADLLFNDLDRLREMTSKAGRFQVVYAGKAHPQDQKGREIIRRIFQMKESLKNEIKVAYLENYDMELGRLITSGVDLWLNTPRPPLEASGTSGMKAALNGVPSLSVLDGWWIEGHIDGITGWSIGDKLWSPGDTSDPMEDALFLYTKLEQVILPLFYQKQERFIDVMRGAIALNGSFFNTQRMLQQYVLNAYFR